MGAANSVDRETEAVDPLEGCARPRERQMAKEADITSGFLFLPVLLRPRPKHLHSTNAFATHEIILKNDSTCA